MIYSTNVNNIKATLFEKIQENKVVYGQNIFCVLI